MTDTHVATRVGLSVATAAPAMTPGVERLFAAAVGVIVLPLYAPQPLVDVIGPSPDFSLRTASLVAMTPMLGYAAGLVLLVPLIDVLENRRAILLTLLADVVALGIAAAAPSKALFLLAAFVAGCATSAIQMVVPVAASLVDEARRGRIIGNVMSGLMVGILMSRPLASLVGCSLSAAPWVLPWPGSRRWTLAGRSSARSASVSAPWRLRLPASRGLPPMIHACAETDRFWLGLFKEKYRHEDLLGRSYGSRRQALGAPAA